MTHLENIPRQFNFPIIVCFDCQVGYNLYKFIWFVFVSGIHGTICLKRIYFHVYLLCLLVFVCIYITPGLLLVFTWLLIIEPLINSNCNII